MNIETQAILFSCLPILIAAGALANFRSYRGQNVQSRAYSAFVFTRVAMNWWAIVWVIAVGLWYARGRTSSPNSIIELSFAIVCRGFLVPMIQALAVGAIISPVAKHVWPRGATAGNALNRSARRFGVMFIGLLTYTAFITYTVANDWRAAVGALMCLETYILLRPVSQYFITGDLQCCVSTGELYDNLNNMARAGGMQVKRLMYSSPSLPTAANAGAMFRGTVLINQPIIGLLSKEECDAVVSHELAHVKLRHPIIRLCFFIAGLFTTILVVDVLFRMGLSIAAVVAIAGATVISIMMLFYMLTRHCEFTADRESIKICGKPQALITALARIHNYNHIPRNWGRLTSLFVSHPPTVERIARLGAAGCISQSELQSLLQLSDVPSSEHYTIPINQRPRATFAAEPPTFLLAQFGSFAHVVAIGALPLLLGFRSLWAVTIVAIAGAFGYYTVYIRLFRGFAYRRIELVARELNVDLAAPENLPVMVGPADRPGQTAGIQFADVGIVTFRQDRLLFQGKEVRFQLALEDITSMCEETRQTRWANGRTVCVNVKQAETDAPRWLSLRGIPSPTSLSAAPAEREVASAMERWLTSQAGLLPPTPDEQNFPLESSLAINVPTNYRLAAVQRRRRTVILSIVFSLATAYALGVPFASVTSAGWLFALPPLLSSYLLYTPAWGSKPLTAGYHKGSVHA